MGRWSAVDPLAEKYAVMSPYVYVANNPVKNVEIDGKYFIGEDGEKVEYIIKNKQILITSNNAGKDLIRLVDLINEGGSRTARKMFKKIGSNTSQVEFDLVDEYISDKDSPEYNQAEIHRPYDENGKLLQWKSSTNDDSYDYGNFNGMPEYLDDGKATYKKAKISIYPGNMKDETIEYDDGESQWTESRQGWLSEYNIQRKALNEITTNEAIVGFFSHSAYHHTSKSQRKLIKKRLEKGKEAPISIENGPDRVTKSTFRQLQRNKSQKFENL